MMNLFQRAVPIAEIQTARAERAEVKQQIANVTFREEVIEELVTVFGFARHVAAEQTNTPAKLAYQAKAIGFA